MNNFRAFVVLALSVLSDIKMTFLLFGCTSSKKVFRPKSREVIVAANGPSFCGDLDKVRKLRKHADFFCVNDFVKTKYYEEFKPDLYFLFDRKFWSNEYRQSVNETQEILEAYRIDLYGCINKKTKWPIKIIVPHYADIDKIESYIKNENVTVVRARFFPYSNISNFSFFAYSSGWFSPRIKNVLIAQIFTSIQLGYDGVYIFGSDFSFVKNLDVDQSTNDVYFSKTHFFNGDAVDRNITSHDMYVWIGSIADIYFSHKIIADYAEWKEVRVVNMSSYSLIDSYKRP